MNLPMGIKFPIGFDPSADDGGRWFTAAELVDIVPIAAGQRQRG
jgi:hypothetical protein